jgi:hypothetical protein
MFMAVVSIQQVAAKQAASSSVRREDTNPHAE